MTVRYLHDHCTLCDIRDSIEHAQSILTNASWMIYAAQKTGQLSRDKKNELLDLISLDVMNNVHTAKETLIQLIDECPGLEAVNASHPNIASKSRQDANNASR